MLLTVSVPVLEAKVDYCEKEGIDWRKKPQILVLGLGDDKKEGALPRRVNMIKNEFGENPIPPELDYRAHPQILIHPDCDLKNKLKRYQ
jgi:hypothetical protein